MSNAAFAIVSFKLEENSYLTGGSRLLGITNWSPGGCYIIVLLCMFVCEFRFVRAVLEILVDGSVPVHLGYFGISIALLSSTGNSRGSGVPRLLGL